MKLKAGIIGLGRIATLYEEYRRARKFYPYLTHAGSYSKHPSVELLCGADIDEERLKRFGSAWGVNRLYRDYRKMVEENDLDIVSICTYPNQHYNIIREIAGSVKVIFCEKPFTNNSEEIKGIIRSGEKDTAKITINLYREYDRSHMQVRNLLKSGVFGEVQRVHCSYGKGLRNQGTHLIGYLIGTLGIPGKINVMGKKKYYGMDECAYDVYMEFGKGISSYIQACDFNNYRLFELDFICEKGRIQILDEGFTIKVFDTCENRAETGAYELCEKKGHVKTTIGYSMRYAIDHIVKLARSEVREPIVSPEKYLELQLVIEEIERQGGAVQCIQS